MRIERFAAYRFSAPFKRTFRHSRAARSEASSLIVAARSADGLVGYGEGCPREYVTGETLAGGLAFIRETSPDLTANVRNIDELRAWTMAREDAIDRNPAAFCAMELAMLDLFGKASERSLEAVLGLPPLAGTFRYTAVLGDASPLATRLLSRRCLRRGFRDFKAKLSGDPQRDRRRLRALRDARPRVRLRLDANNLWQGAESCIRHLRALDADLFAVEEPLRVGDLAGFREVGRAVAAKIVLDESLLRAEQVAALDGADAVGWLANLRVSKLGGLLRTLQVARRAAQRGIGVIVGCQVGETSILTRAGLAAMHAAGPNLVASEGAFGTHLLRRDLTEPCLMFGQGGALGEAERPGPGAAGLGLAIRSRDLNRAGGRDKRKTP